jgi:Pentapeptide repeats (8 copies)
VTADILAGADLAGADMAGTDMAGTDMAGTDLPGADMAGTDMAGTDLAGDDLAGDDLAGDDLTGVATSDLLAADGSAADDDSLGEAAPGRIGRRRRIRGTDGDSRARARNPWAKWVLIGLGVVLVAGGVAWAVAASSGTRLPGEEITGQALGPEAATQSLQAAEQAVGKDDDVTALEDFQKVLNSYPNQPEALTGAGWILAQTQQPSLLQQGLTMLTSAEKADPSYAPAHLYRGVTLLSEDNYAGAIPELRWYLAHSPDPQLKAKVQSALQTAVTKQAQAQKTNAGG